MRCGHTEELFLISLLKMLKLLLFVTLFAFTFAVAVNPEVSKLEELAESLPEDITLAQLDQYPQLATLIEMTPSNLVLNSAKDTCGGKCPFTLVSATLNPTKPVPGKPVAINITGKNTGTLEQGAIFSCKTCINVFILGCVSTGDATVGQACEGGEDGGEIKCPFTEDNLTLTMDVPDNAVSGSYKSSCTFTNPDGQVFAKGDITFSI